ncbi:hypothetical protein L873DRAFT_457109 [Choiromyces venosus 120613-1]|uniref:Uncharacterized protein n=1 Tax=Choiromyces venosus 120613-1 TaxID=1336337 RepID=A0A3N4K1U3_9PEZI|nr:hypothetical protein L873DRAFT_457109 [Choiromyces venosus 120613-1]
MMMMMSRVHQEYLPHLIIFELDKVVLRRNITYKSPIAFSSLIKFIRVLKNTHCSTIIYSQCSNHHSIFFTNKAVGKSFTPPILPPHSHKANNPRPILPYLTSSHSLVIYLRLTKQNFKMPNTSSLPRQSIDSSTSASTILQRPLLGSSESAKASASAGSKIKAVFRKLRAGGEPATSSSKKEEEGEKGEKEGGKRKGKGKSPRGQYAGEMRLNF